jgi:hypothetical protein
VARILATADARFDAVQDATAPEGMRSRPEEEPTRRPDDDAKKAKKKDAKEEGVEEKGVAAGGGESKAAKGSPDDPRRCWPLHLFCRMEGCEYVYCGRLRLHEANARKRPMRFEFRLLDAPLLRHSDEFLGLVDLADADASLGELEAKARAASERMKQEKEARGR